MFLTILSVSFIIAIILIAHFIAPKEYKFKINTISELAAQKYAYKMLMQAGFIGFGLFLTSAIIFIWVYKGFGIKYIPIMIYSLSILLSGIFSTKPFNNDKDYSEIQSKLHSLFAQLAGFSFSIGILAYFFYTDSFQLKIVHFSFFLFVISVSMLFGKIQSIRGILQRILYLGSFLWVVLFVK